MILTEFSDKDPLPPILSIYADAGFITAYHFALANSLTHRRCFCLRCDEGTGTRLNSVFSVAEKI